MAQQEHDLVTEIMKGARIATLSYIDEQGRVVSMPMGTQEMDDPGVVHFITEADSDKMRAIAANPQVNVAYSSGKGWVSLSGTAARNDDRALLERLWGAANDAIMSGGPDDPGTTVLTVSGDTATYWESPGKVATAVQLVKGAVSDDDPDLGDSGTVRV